MPAGCSNKFLQTGGFFFLIELFGFWVWFLLLFVYKIIECYLLTLRGAYTSHPSNVRSPHRKDKIALWYDSVKLICFYPSQPGFIKLCNMHFIYGWCLWFISCSFFLACLFLNFLNEFPSCICVIWFAFSLIVILSLDSREQGPNIWWFEECANEEDISFCFTFPYQHSV